MIESKEQLTVVQIHKIHGGCVDLIRRLENIVKAYLV